MSADRRSGGFDPRPCERGDGFLLHERGPQKRFDPRPCERGDAAFALRLFPDTCFDPRPCERGDDISTTLRHKSRKFRSTPLREGRRQQKGAQAAPDPGFDPRPCERGDAMAEIERLQADLFRSTPLREGRRTVRASRRDVPPFRSTPLREGRPVAAAVTRPWSAFRSTPLREGRHRRRVRRHARARRFDPRPCERGDDRHPRARARQRVSIHAPARGATSFRPDWWFVIAVSIHAPARGATSPPWRGDPRSKSFDPRPCERGDRKSTIRAPAFSSFDPRPCERGDDRHPRARARQRVSIHAPARGATEAPDRWRKACGVSIHAPARGATRRFVHALGPLSFRSTPLREGRQRQSTPFSTIGRFDPRPCERGD